MARRLSREQRIAQHNEYLDDATMNTLDAAIKTEKIPNDIKRLIATRVFAKAIRQGFSLRQVCKYQSLNKLRV